MGKTIGKLALADATQSLMTDYEELNRDRYDTDGGQFGCSVLVP